MPVKIRLARRGRRKQPFYHIVVADARAPRDGKFIEKIGSYNPMTKPATILLDGDKAFEWLKQGAQPTDTARAILTFRGVLSKKHLQSGVSRGALTQADADKKYEEFVAAKDAKVAARFEQSLQEKLDFQRQVNGTPKKVYVAEAPAAEAAEAFRETEGDAAATEEAPATDAPAAEAPAADAPVAEAPAAEEE